MSVNDQSQGQRSLGVSALGVLLLLVGGALAYLGYLTSTNATASTTPAAYEYTVKQSAEATMTYFDSSFYQGQAPSAQNNAYVSELTNTINSKFHYNYTADKSATLTTSYEVTAQLQATYALQGSTDSSSNVWQKDYPLIKRTTSTTTGMQVTLNPTATVPYAEYKQIAQQYRTALTLPTTSQVVVVFTVQTTGTVDGMPISDTRTSTITVPLEQQIYQPLIKFDKEDTKHIVPADAKAGSDRTAKAQLIGGSALAIAGLAMVVYGLRKRIFKSAYRRELDKIYRVNDGILVRTSRPVDLAGQHVVPVRSFEDMLNLEEELKTPIIADEISSTLTHFIIAHGNVMYLYKLTDKGDDEPIAYQPDPQPSHSTPPAGSAHGELQRVHTYGLAPALKAAPRMNDISPKKPLNANTRPATAKPTELDDIISEIGKKPTRHPKPKA